MESGPTGEQLWTGAVLASLAHAAFIVHTPDLSNEQSWEGANYSVQDSQGARGTVSFGAEGVVGVFFDVHSPRASGGAEVAPLLAGMPPGLRSLADREALQYVLQDAGGEPRPAITAAFWTPGRGPLAGAEPWDDIVEHGAHLVHVQLLEPERALEAWRAYYDLDDARVTLVWSLFQRRIARPHERLRLTPDERAVLTQDGDAGLNDVRELLDGIGIDVP